MFRNSSNLNQLVIAVALSIPTLQWLWFSHCKSWDLKFEEICWFRMRIFIGGKPFGVDAAHFFIGGYFSLSFRSISELICELSQ